MPKFRRFGIFGFAALVLAMIGLSPASSAHAAPPVIGLFTDYGWDDPYMAQIKGVIVSINPNARLLDITHSVTPFNVTEGAWLLDQCAGEFPAGTIFVAVVDPQVGTERDPILLETAKGKFYIGPDNGLFTRVVAREGFLKAWVLDKPQFFRADGVSRTFHGRDIFGPVAAHLAEGADPERLGTPVKALVTLPDKEPTFSDGLISTEVLHIDRYGNVLLNLPADSDIAAKLKEGNLVRISIGRESYSAPLVKTYGDVDKGRLLLLYGGGGLLEIGVNQGSANRQLKVEPGATVYLKP
ncbi:MAG TPA: SAM-dependent chlorinase/fluorinase [Candidatus Methylacidiphilales bacterium]|jgi:S-adenosylmethionine hydrolase|nr:SAM-dependent chlorinase/fluorinase [Candidatus Methylacidiphilales bacterium]